ncbi:MAG TPA: hypothetical protein VFQ39_03310 [Longimicrobium sp.]|nr:hypothetical protein [Longimicrobium sp.]
MDAIRDAARRAVEVESVRRVAAAMDISPAGLRYFLSGGEPYRHTFRKLVAWYARFGRALDGLSPQVTEAALSTLLEGLPDELRDIVRARMADTVRAACVERGLAPPKWSESPPPRRPPP